MAPRTLLIAQPRGFCAGVVRAYDIVDQTLELSDEPVYVLKEIVHNRHVVNELREKGATFVQSLDEVPEGARSIFSAHGVSPAVRQQAASRRLRMIDATCPLVTKVHLQAKKYADAGYTILLVGHKEHDEVIGTSGEAPGQTIVVENRAEVAHLQVPDPEKVLMVTQTTLSVEDTAEVTRAILERFPKAQVRNDICFATTNRQAAVKEMAKEAQLILVVGAKNSSNSVRLMEVAQAAGCKAHLIDTLSQIDPAWLQGVECVGLTSGASTPERLVQEIIDYFSSLGTTEVREVRVAEETISFSPPPELQELLAARVE